MTGGKVALPFGLIEIVGGIGILTGTGTDRAPFTGWLCVGLGVLVIVLCIALIWNGRA